MLQVTLWEPTNIKDSLAVGVFHVKHILAKITTMQTGWNGFGNWVNFIQTIVPNHSPTGWNTQSL